MIIIAGTGHRPKKLGGYGDAVHQRLISLVGGHLSKLPEVPAKIISGMALGFDQALAIAAISAGIPVVAAIPFKGQEERWPAHSRHLYRSILHVCSEVIAVSPGHYSANKMSIRNRWMVDNCTEVLALFDGSEGGTANCVAYAIQKERPVVNLWDRWSITPAPAM